MTSYAAFYVGRGEDAEWLGTVGGDDIPGLLAVAPRIVPRPLDASSEGSYRAAVTALLREWNRSVDHAYAPDPGDPNDYSELADLAYAFDRGKVWVRATRTGAWKPARAPSPGTYIRLPVKVGAVLPGGLRVDAVELADRGRTEQCLDCGRLLGRETVLRVSEVGAPDERDVLHPRCAERRREIPLGFIPPCAHDAAVSRLGEVVNELSELNRPGSEFEQLLDELDSAFGALHRLVKSDAAGDDTTA
ncbi:hypothetical protein [Amycolatopsis sp. CA-230715]|uniref:hypothetical protein n=1 Tax=Amycolatopsis sp. CA-230715 TaxID=2745196 RepID=UPI001C01B035|nr:hypothetical protein [Amycolatopsis sp. CA-230715]QWF81033.1 hypothetical protein HUW46_04458 [Amycolatopsis sp. CA-230715]